VCGLSEEGGAGAGVEVEGLVVGVDGIAEGLPCGEAAAEKLDPGELLLVGLADDEAAGDVAGAGAIDDDVLVAGDEVGIGFEFAGGDAAGGGNDGGVGEKIEGQADVEDEDFKLGGEGLRATLRRRCCSW
jgi:hypothetical protein